MWPLQSTRSLTRRAARAVGLFAGFGVFAINLIGPAGSADAATLRPEVTIEADDETSFPKSYAVVDRLAPDTVLQMRVVGFEPFERAIAEQCASHDLTRCGNRVPVQFDEGGVARFQYLVNDAFLDSEQISGACRFDATPCSIVVRALESGTHAKIQTVFIDTVPSPGQIAVTPAHELSLDGETVTVEVENYPPGAELTATLCGAPDVFGARCGEPGPTARLVVGSDGSGHTRLVIKPGAVGTDRVRCFRGDDCGVSVASETVFARAPVVPISFAAPPGSEYDTNRLAIGLAVAVLLAAIAAGLIRRTDWSAVGEAAAPEIDDADYADLDAIIAALPPEEDELVSPH
ncbi:MAG: hypothetical protein QOF28_2338 [Actinomycetota bacterium]|jgi:hypothetical protein|nr:hypothetical protein [Actinomycetota bacterium]